MAKKLTTESFILKAKEIHGDKYDYSKVEYVNMNTKICIICPIHGEFEQLPLNHLRKHECPKCMLEKNAKNRALTTEEFVQKAKEVHGDKYDYSKVEYKKAKTKVCIICPIHGEFWQTPHKHLIGQGCELCARIERAAKKSFTKEIFIEKAIKIHGNKYDYSKVEYVNISTKVCIICPIHGEFWQTPSGHLSGNGCNQCRKLSTEKFIEQSIKIHGNKYDYSKVDYKNANIKVTIICPIHGEFQQTPSSHLKGCGCKKCTNSFLENNINEFLTNNNLEFESQKKFQWLKRQSLDFYLPNHNIAIECQGKQHFKPIEFFGGEKHFKYIMNIDERKYNLCKENNIKILYFTNVNEKYIPSSYFDDIYINKEDLLNAIKEYGINTRT